MHKKGLCYHLNKVLVIALFGLRATSHSGMEKSVGSSSSSLIDLSGMDWKWRLFFCILTLLHYHHTQAAIGVASPPPSLNGGGEITSPSAAPFQTFPCSGGGAGGVYRKCGETEIGDLGILWRSLLQRFPPYTSISESISWNQTSKAYVRFEYIYTYVIQPYEEIKGNTQA